MLRKAVLGLVLMPLLLPCLAWGQAEYAASLATTREVILYPDRAMVKKSLRVSVGRGETSFDITGLVPSLIDDSVQAGISAADKVSVLDIQVRRTALVKPVQERLRTLQNRLDEIEKEIVGHKNEREVNSQAIAFLQKVLPFPQEQNTTFQVVQNYLGSLEQALAARLENIARLDQVIVVLEKKKAELEKELQALGPPREESKSLRVTVFAESDALFELNYSYFLADARWRPLYEVRADTEQQRVSLHFFAVVQQATGEDLGGAGIELSTARPSVSGEIPPLSPWRIDLYEPPPMAYRSVAADRLLKMAESAPMESMATAAYEPEVSSEATSMSYRVNRKIALPSDNQPHKILISTSEAESTFEYLAVPRLSRFASLTAVLKNPFVYPLLEGELKIFLDGRYVGTNRVAASIPAGEEMRLALGMDETILVTHSLQEQFTEEIGAFSKQTRKHFAYKAAIINGKTRPVRLLIRDQVPVSTHEKIAVSIASPAGTEAEVAKDGTVTWKRELAAGEKQEFVTRFHVTYPADEQVSGL
ncbi:mucoidy inhibitor MuiA family protein [Desulfuromonas sp. AOP6]|uniref:mucoidy inhibitor MuiA family protein n=1 Tax=Desulfuromonas sp. AOP6 TaxID=1566351 RepID=UPI001279005F|nr:mucoidy inhibitor MuiA family protein [Desulfuromonas sp. AOP6]BCA81024.1 hypothetical protein AOP6_2811 [Desulfuromonas sp. AOP6]